MASLSRQQSVNGRASRASNSSSRSKAGQAQGPPTSDMFSSAVSGVMSMLKTSTDVGDIGEFSFNTGRLPAMLRPTHQRRNHPAHLSGSSAHSTYTSHTNHSRAQSQMSKRTSNAPNTRGWDAVSAVSSANGHGMGARHGSMVSLQTQSTVPPQDGRAPIPRGYSRSSPYGPHYAKEGRSYSLTQTQQSSSIRPVRSAASLRSQGNRQFQPPRPPFAYPKRAKRTEFRPPPPAQADYSTYQMPSGPPGTFGGDQGYLHDFPQNYADRIQPSYANPYEQQQQLRHGLPPGHYYGHGTGSNLGNSMNRPPVPTYNDEIYESSMTPRYPGNVHTAFRQPNADRLAELDAYDYGSSLPQQRYAPALQAASRAGTPLVEPMPSSSEQGSSAPASSNPPTPRDFATVHVTIGLASNEQALAEFSDEHSDYKRVQSYIRYAEQPALYELDAAVPAAELETNTPTLRTGFVKRIKNLLEDKAAGQETPASSEHSQIQQDTSRKIVIPPSLKHSGHELSQPPVSKRSSVHEPFELDVPARITRTLIKANTAPSSSEQNTTTSVIPDEVTTPLAERFVDPGPVQPHIREVASTSTVNPTSQDQAKDNAIESPKRPDLTKHSPPRRRLEKDLYRDKAGELGLEEPDSGCVSSLRSTEKVVRDSVVSPMATQTVQVTVIQDPAEPQGIASGQSVAVESSKAVAAAHQHADASDLNSGLSSAFDMNREIGPTSEPMTDVALKFSLPRTANCGKAQLVNLSSPSETPIQASIDGSKKDGGEDNTLHSSLSSINKVAPLQVRKKESLSPMLSGVEGADFSSFIRRSFPRKKSLWSTGQASSVRGSADMSLDFQPLPTRPHALSGLKEDSKEDIGPSNSAARLSNSQMFHLRPARENLKRSDENLQSSYLIPRPPRMSLSELRSIPSLNFSRMNLVDRLNEVLDTRVTRMSKSLEAVRRGDAIVDRPSRAVGPARSASTEVFQDRYASFFTRPDETKMIETSGSEGDHTEPLSSDSASSKDDRLAGVDQPTEYARAGSAIVSNPTMDRSHSCSVRPRSPGRILSVAQEVNRLSIPSVAALSERLSELLPSIKHLNLDSAVGTDIAVKNTIDEIHHLGRPDSDNTGLLRSSTGLRQLAAVADNIAVHGTHDSAILETKNGRLMKELPPLPEDTEKFSLSESGLDRNTTLIEGVSSTAELEAPKPVLLRGKSLSGIDSRDDDLHPGYPIPSRRSLVLSSQSLRPWNQEENYPWCGNSPALNIALSSPVVHQDSSTSETIRRTSKVSSDTRSDTEGTAEPGSILLSSQLVSSGEVVTPSTGLTHRRSSKKSIIGSLSRRMGLSTRSQSKAAIRDSTMTEKPHTAGDRYPNTGLHPPNTFNIDEVRSFFSDSASEEHGEARRGSFRRHITSLRSRLPNNQSCAVSLDMHRARSQDHYGRASHANASGSLFDDRFTDHITPPNYDGMVGMGKMEFRVKRVAERLRHFWSKGGDVIRSLSQRSHPAAARQHRDRHTDADNWLADSLYSGD